MMFLIEFLRSILEFFFALTSSHGWSIILLSFAVTIIMLPFFWVAEVIQEKERARKLRMQPALDKLKDVDNQQEKYYYTRNIYRQHDYSPMYALTGLLGLLIQIPFFLAAYWMLLLYSPLEGVSFGLVTDLSQPDGLLSFQGFSINGLPFLMAGINLLAGHLYLEKGNKGERIQQLVLAIVFLILLYNLSAALVLYWTMNNAFSIGKNFLLKKVVRKESGAKYFATVLPKLKENRHFIFLVLFSTFPILSFYYENIEQMGFLKMAPFLAATVLTTAAAYFTTKQVFRDRLKALVLVFLAVVLFFSYGHLHEFLTVANISIPRGGLIGLYAFTFLAGFALLLKFNTRLKKTANVLSIFSACLFSVVVIRVFAHDVSTLNNRLYLDTLSDDAPPVLKPTTTIEMDRPDIYYLILDGYANSTVLKDVCNYDNSTFENYLTEQGFYIATEGRSNYVQTHLSLAATLNMKQINYLASALGEESTNANIPYYMLSNNAVMDYLENKGYKTINFSSGWGATNYNKYADINFSFSDKIDEVASTFIQTTLLYPFVKFFSDPKTSYRNSILYTLEHIPDLDSIAAPKFVFAHIVCPHPPYVFRKDGSPVLSKLKLDNSWIGPEKKYYIEQLEYLNGRVKEILETILKKDEDAVIIIQSDHGSAFLADDWSNPGPEFIKERTKIFNAILLKGRGRELLYPQISSVNTFPVIFNGIFGEAFELREDSTYFSSYEQPYNFNNVTEVLNTE